jgi:putative tricarboxylic transport membrane protein
MSNLSSESRRSADLLTSDRCSGTILVAIAAFAVWQNSGLPLGSLSEPGPGSVPLILAVLLGLTGVLIAVFGARSLPVRELGWADARRAIAIIAALGFATMAFERLGYRLTVIALLVFLIGAVERRHPVSVIAVSFGFAFISYWIFNSLLLVQLPRGPWGF